MSSSKKKQARKEQGVTGRQSSAAQEAKQLKRYTWTFWIVIALVMVLFVGALANQFVIDPIANVINNSVYPKTDAIQVGNHTLTSVDLNYFYVSTFNTYYYNVYSTYYTYIYYGLYTLEQCLGFNPSKSLAKQDLTDDLKTALDTEADTWADYFMESTARSIRSVYSLYDLAQAKGHKLTDDEQKDLDDSIASLETNAKEYRSVKAYLRDVYGNGADEDSYINYLTVSAYANSYYTAYKDSLEFTQDQLKEYGDNEDKAYLYNSYAYTYYKINVSDFVKSDVTDSNGDPVFENDADKTAAYAAARTAAKEAAEKLAAGEYATVEDFRKAVISLDKDIQKNNAQTKAADKDETVSDSVEDPDNYTDQDRYLLYTNVTSVLRDWIVGKTEKENTDANAEKEYTYSPRKAGETDVVPNTTDADSVSTFYVVRSNGYIDNNELMRNVRHILIKCDVTENSDGSLTIEDDDKEDAEKAEKKANELLQEYLENPTEEKFTELAKANSEDSNKSEGGLYEDVYRGQMVSQFEDWLYDADRKAGDAEVVMTKYGYHVMYYVGESEDYYRYSMIDDDLRDETVEDWLEDLIDSIDYDEITLKHLKVKFS